MKWLAKLRYGPLTRDRCEVCGAHLRVKQRVEIVAVDEGPTEFGMGGFAMTATYCQKDAP